jgi:lipoprotein-anchoring transpeptidase ErfK/SrfK
MKTRTLMIVASLMAAMMASEAPAQSSGARPATTASDVAPSMRNRAVPEKYKRRMVRFSTNEAPGTIIVDTHNKFLYYVEGKNRATRYGIGVGREGFGWSGVVKIGRKAEWPSWTPPAEMRRREAARGHMLPAVQKGGPDNPLGARAMYLYKVAATRSSASTAPTSRGRSDSTFLPAASDDEQGRRAPLRAGAGRHQGRCCRPRQQARRRCLPGSRIDIFRTLFGG